MQVQEIRLIVTSCGRETGQPRSFLLLDASSALQVHRRGKRQSSPSHAGDIPTSSPCTEDLTTACARTPCTWLRPARALRMTAAGSPAPHGRVLARLPSLTPPSSVSGCSASADARAHAHRHSSARWPPSDSVDLVEGNRVPLPITQNELGDALVSRRCTSTAQSRTCVRWAGRMGERRADRSRLENLKAAGEFDPGYLTSTGATSSHEPPHPPAGSGCDD
jgi:hypothetical protein